MKNQAMGIREWKTSLTFQRWISRLGDDIQNIHWLDCEASTNLGCFWMLHIKRRTVLVLLPSAPRECQWRTVCRNAARLFSPQHEEGRGDGQLTFKEDINRGVCYPEPTREMVTIGCQSDIRQKRTLPEWKHWGHVLASLVYMTVQKWFGMALLLPRIQRNKITMNRGSVSSNNWGQLGKQDSLQLQAGNKASATFGTLFVHQGIQTR